MNKESIKVLVVDDSYFFRETFAKKLSKDPDIEVIAKARDAYEARDMIIKYRPHVMLLEVELPKMNGIEFLKRLMPQYPMPAIVVSDVNDKVFDALNAGAVEFVIKPSFNHNIDGFLKELIIKIKIASKAKVGYHKRINKRISYVADHQLIDDDDICDKIIAIGASTGGTNALFDILKVLPADHMPGIVIVQHMPPIFTKLYAERLNDHCTLDVKEAEDGDEILPGCAFVAPGGFHMRVVKTGKRYYIQTEKGTETNKVSGHCPSVDVLFHSVAQNIGSNAIGIILTGMGKDGANGLLTMKKKGALTIGQDEETSAVYGMPKVAYDIGAVDKQLPLLQIPQGILKRLSS